jgi:hypothetical protein
MKQKLMYLSLIAMFFITCSKQQEFELSPQLESQSISSNKKSAHIYELIIQYVNNAGVYQNGTFYMNEVVSQRFWQSKNATASGPNFSAAQWDTGIPTFNAGIYYYVFPPGNFPKDVLKIKYDQVYCSPSPDSYFKYNKDTKKYSVIKTGCGVSYEIIRFNDHPFNYDHN